MRSVRMMLVSKTSPLFGLALLVLLMVVATTSTPSRLGVSAEETLASKMDRIEGALKDLAAQATVALSNRYSTLSQCRSSSSSGSNGGNLVCTPRGCDVPPVSTDRFECYFGNVTSAAQYGNITTLCGGEEFNSTTSVGLLRSTTTSVAVFPSNMNYSSLDAEAFMCATKSLDPHFESKAASGELEGFQYLVETSTGATRKYPGVPSNETQCTKGLEGFPWFVQGTSGPKDVMVIYDMSSSMSAADGPGGMTRYEGAKQAIYAVLDTLSSEDRIGLVWFDRAGHKQSGDHLLYATPGNVSSLKTLVQNLPQDGSGTNFEDGFTKAFEVLASTPVRESGLVLQPTLLFLTDGSPNTGETSKTDFLALIDGWQSGLAKPATIMTYNLGSDSSGTVRIPKAIACANQGVWEFIDEGESIAAIMGRYYKVFKFGTQTRVGPPIVAWSAPYLRSSLDNEPIVSASIPIYSVSSATSGSGGLLAILATEVTLSGLGLEPSISQQQTNNYDLLLTLIESRNTHIKTTTTFSWCQLQVARAEAGGYVCEDDEAPAGTDTTCSGTPAPTGSGGGGTGTVVEANVNNTLCSSQSSSSDPPVPHVGNQPMCCFNPTPEPTPIPPTPVPDTPVPETTTPAPPPTPAPLPTCTSDADCPCSYCKNEAGRVPPYFCHASQPPGGCAPATTTTTMVPDTPTTAGEPSCSSDADCPCSYCKNEAGRAPPFYCQTDPRLCTPAPTVEPTPEPPMPPPTVNCNTTDDCPCSYCMNGPGRSPPFFCHRDPNTACNTPIPPTPQPPTPALPSTTTTGAGTTTTLESTTTTTPESTTTTNASTTTTTASPGPTNPAPTPPGGNGSGKTITRTLTLSKSMTPKDLLVNKAAFDEEGEDSFPYWIIALIVGLLLCCIGILLARKKLVHRDRSANKYLDNTKYTKDFVVDVDQAVLEANERVVAQENEEMTLKYIMKQKKMESSAEEGDSGSGGSGSGDAPPPPDLEALLATTNGENLNMGDYEITSKTTDRKLEVFDPSVDLDEMRPLHTEASISGPLLAVPAAGVGKKKKQSPSLKVGGSSGPQVQVDDLNVDLDEDELLGSPSAPPLRAGDQTNGGYIHKDMVAPPSRLDQPPGGGGNLQFADI